MRRMSFRTLGLFFSLVPVTSAFCGEAPVKGKVDAVTVYRGQALITRAVDLKAPAGLQEVVVTDLPARVIPGSIYAEGDEGVEVRSVLYRERAVDQDIREEVRKLDAQIRDVQDKIAASKRQGEVLAERKAYLQRLQQFTAPTATFELTKGVLNADTLQKVTTFQFEQFQTIATEEIKLSTQERDLAEQQNVLQRQRNELTGGSARTVREALVFVNLAKADGAFRLRYLVENASWTPSYNIRADAKRDKVVVEYDASIQQMSGEDWTGVQMTLSTATPSLVARAPALVPLTVALAPLAQTKLVVQTADEYGNQRDLIVERRNKAQQGRGGNFNNDLQSQIANNANPNFNAKQQVEQADNDLNDIAGELQILDLVAKGKISKKQEKSRAIADESVSVTYELPGRTSLPSRASEQLIQIASMPMKSEFYKTAIPLLTNYVYEEASLTNESKLVLLAGPASTFVAKQFVGRGEVPTVAIGESFTVGFGIDASLRAERELVEKTDTIQGGNRVQSFTYRLQVENFNGEAAAVRILERLPTAKENEIRVVPAPMSLEISKDPMYEKNEHKKGILRWDASVPAQAIGPKAFSIQYQFSLEYDRQMGIAGTPPPNRNPFGIPSPAEKK
ncbi:MAG TPA: mucoidy inhibitor MuiA family protein [Planctomycetota bacterium]|nr:mucoidy inhibitor MuiA family protein [Planctomycetota bacterium]